MRVQPLPAIFGANASTNNSVKLLARILALEMIPPHTPAIIIYDSDVVYSHHLSLLSNNLTQRRLTHSVLPSISKYFSHWLQQTIIHHTLLLPPSYPTIDMT